MSSLSDHCSMNGGISLSRNASSSSLNATSAGDHAKSTNLTLPSGPASVSLAQANLTVHARAETMDFVFSPEQLARRGAHVPRGRGTERLRAPHGRARRRRHHPRGLAPHRRPRLDRPARARVGRRARTRHRRHGGGAGRDGPQRVPRPLLLVGDPRDARPHAPSVSTISSPRSRSGTQRGNGRARRSRLRRSDRTRARARQRAAALATSSTA